MRTGTIWSSSLRHLGHSQVNNMHLLMAFKATERKAAAAANARTEKRTEKRSVIGGAAGAGAAAQGGIGMNETEERT